MSLAFQLKAGGQKSPPQTIQVGDHFFQREKIYKHDFFAVTALYKPQPPVNNHTKPFPKKIILKWSRSTSFCAFPLSWLGRWITRHELSILKRLQPLANIPRLIGPYKSHGLLYEYIEGVSLDSKPAIPDDFFDQLEEIIQAVHKQNIAYLDLNKKGNILLGKDNKPYLIDFQISWYYKNL